MSHADPLLIQSVEHPICGVVCPPGSKSLTNRALIIAALANCPTRLSGLLASDDTRVMIDSLQKLGFDVAHNIEKCHLDISGHAGSIPAKSAKLFLENSGTSIRFLTALCALGHGKYQLDGNKRMRERPIIHLINALQQWGVDAQCEKTTGCPPVQINGNGLQGKVCSVAGNLSSQYLSALLMVAPAAHNGASILIEGELVSRPYIEMTIRVMEQFGVTVTHENFTQFHIAPQSYTSMTGEKQIQYEIEPDASAASYFFAAAAITEGEVTVKGLSRNSLQGDVAFVDLLQQMGCKVTSTANSITVRGAQQLQGIDIDMNGISDTAQTLAAVALFAKGETRIRNIEHVRHKETDRIDAVATELQRIGIDVKTFDDGLLITPGEIKPGVIQTYDDHRMAMSFALIGLRAKGIQIADPKCTAKTYPHYFDDLQRLCKNF